MAKRSAIPQDTKEWPDYEFRAFPRWIGRDEFGQDLIANSAEEVEELSKLRVYPMDLGLDRHGKLVQALHPDEVSIKKTWVTRPVETVAESASNKLTEKTEASGGKKKAA